MKLNTLASATRRVASFRLPGGTLAFGTTNLTVLALALALVALKITFARLGISGAAQFDRSGLIFEFFSFGVLAVICKIAVRPRYDFDTPRWQWRDYFAIALATTLLLEIIFGGLHALLTRTGIYSYEVMGVRGLWLYWWSATLAATLPLIVLFVRTAATRARAALAVAMVIAEFALIFIAQPPAYFEAVDTSTAMTEDDASVRERKNSDYLTPNALAVQMGLLKTQLSQLPAQRPGVVDVYTLIFTPYAAENVFKNEARVVTETIASRFDTGGRSIALMNHKTTIRTNPWATRENLREALAHIAKVVDPNEDLVLIHLASHGGQDAELATAHWPFKIDAINAVDLRRAIDDAKIASHIVSISACYAGTWLKELARPNALVITASDADHTSYGCGHKSELTYFTRAIYAEALQTTRSFERALEIARPVIEQREKDGGKDDGFSNPQIRVGDAIRPLLERLESQRVGVTP